MPADSRPVDGAVYPHRSDDPGRGNRPAHHRGRIYRLGVFCYLFRRIGGIEERHALLADFPLPVCGGHPTGCVLAQQAFRRRRRLACVLGHGSHRRGHFPYHLPQGDCKTCDDGLKGMNAEGKYIVNKRVKHPYSWAKTTVYQILSNPVYLG